MTRSFTGRHMTAILAAFFGVVIAVNFTMATFASTTFGGIVVENSYVASQQFNDWLGEAEAQRALGWEAVAEHLPDGRVAVTLAGVPGGATVTAEARHPLGRLPDHALTFAATTGSRFLSIEPLPQGRWTLRLEVRAGGKFSRSEQVLP